MHAELDTWLEKSISKYRKPGTSRSTAGGNVPAAFDPMKLVSELFFGKPKT
jgi:hypothetical protein